MLNSLTVFLAFLAFLIFGYASFIRLMVKREFGTFPISSILSAIKDLRGLSSLGSSAFFVGLPATSLLLFWGWGPALIWLLMFHLLVETIFQLQYTTTEQDYSLAELLVRTGSPRVALLESTLVQSFFILLMSTVVALLATMIDKQSGLMFALIALFPAQQLLRSTNVSVPFSVKFLCAAAVISVGILFAHQLGFGIYGDLAPLENVWGGSLNWLRVNNVSLIAGTLILASLLLAEKKQFQTDVATLSGGFIIFLIVVLAARLLWLQPILDAPLNVTQTATNELPSFIGLSLFIFAGLGALLIRLLNDETNYNDANTSATCFARLQSESLINLVFLVVLVLSLASAIGIGAWKTHYALWSDSASFVTQLDIAVNSILQMVHSSLKTGTFLHTMIMVGLSVAGISFLMMCVTRFKITRHNQGDDSSLLDVAMSNKVPQAFIIFLVSCYFIQHGIPSKIWMIIGMLSWALVVHLMLTITHDMQDPSLRRLTYGGVTLGLVGLGVVQTLWVSISWFILGNIAIACIAMAILVSCTALWWHSVIELVGRFSAGTEKDLFNDKNLP